MRFHADQHFVAALAMREDGNEIGLGAAWNKQTAIKAQL
jgi:hypothetical protein